MSKIEVNTIEPQCGTTLTLGESRRYCSIRNRCSQTGFGRYRYCTIGKQLNKTLATFTAADGEGTILSKQRHSSKWKSIYNELYQVNLPAGSAGYCSSVQDYASNFQQ